MPFNGEQYRPDVRVFLPTEDPAAPLVIERPAGKLATDSRQFVATIAPQETDHAGIYEMWFSRVDGSIQADRFAVNVEAREGDLAQTSTQDIVAHLDPVPVDMGYADQYESAAIEQSGFNQSVLLMGLLILLLVGEQVLAYFNSFHAQSRHAAGPSGTPRPPGQHPTAAGTERSGRTGRTGPAPRRPSDGSTGHQRPPDRLTRTCSLEECHSDTRMVPAGGERQPHVLPIRTPAIDVRMVAWVVADRDLRRDCRLCGRDVLA